MVGSPLGLKCQMNGSICSEVVEKHSEGQLLTPVSSVGRYPVLSSKKGAQILKKNPSYGLNTKVLSGKEAECCTRELRSTETRKRSSFSSPTISSSRKIRHKVQVQQIEPRLKKDSASEAMKTSQEKDTPVPSRPSLLIPEKMKMISAPPHFLQKITPIRTSIHPSQPTTTHTKSSTPLRTSSNPQLLHQKTQNKAPVFQSIQKSPTSQPLQKRICNQNSVSQSGPSKQYVSRRSGNQKTLVPSWALQGKTRLPTSIRQSKSSTSTNKSSRIRERCWGDEEPIHHISWEGLNETFHPWGITCPLCENDLSDMPYGYANEYTDEYHDDVEPSVLPSVAVLSCGHSFHAACLDGITPEESSSDPPCFFCLSCID